MSFPGEAVDKLANRHLSLYREAAEVAEKPDQFDGIHGVMLGKRSGLAQGPNPPYFVPNCACFSGQLQIQVIQIGAAGLDATGRGAGQVPGVGSIEGDAAIRGLGDGTFARQQQGHAG